LIIDAIKKPTVNKKSNTIWFTSSKELMKESASLAKQNLKP
jgi:hypothetical protein